MEDTAIFACRQLSERNGLYERFVASDGNGIKSSWTKTWGSSYGTNIYCGLIRVVMATFLSVKIKLTTLVTLSRQNELVVASANIFSGFEARQQRARKPFFLEWNCFFNVTLKAWNAISASSSTNVCNLSEKIWTS